jgi:hypothetical protein
MTKLKPGNGGGNVAVSNDRLLRLLAMALNLFLSPWTFSYIYTCEPLSAEQKDGTTVVTCHLEGNFPGGRADLRFFFRLERGKIANLEIIP